MMRFLPVLALAGCAPIAPAPLMIQPAVAASAPALAPVTTLAGEWRVAAIDGKPLDEPYGIALSASDKEIWWSPRCAGYARSYRIAGGDFSSGPPLDFVPPRPGDPPRLICLIAPPAKTGAVFEAIESGRTIRRTPQNGVEISGSGHSLLLFSQ